MGNNDLISRSALIAEYDRKHIGHAGAARKLMVDAPAVDAEPVVHGRWIKPTVIGGKGYDIPHCSVCDGVPCGVNESTRFCPNCGAKMDGDGPVPEEDEVCEACAITYSWERGEANILGETNDADE